MKKILFTLLMCCALNANAQFTVYQPAPTPQIRYDSYGRPYTVTPQPKQQEPTTVVKGYYKDMNGIRYFLRFKEIK